MASTNKKPKGLLRVFLDLTSGEWSRGVIVEGRWYGSAPDGTTLVSPTNGLCQGHQLIWFTKCKEYYWRPLKGGPYVQATEVDEAASWLLDLAARPGKK